MGNARHGARSSEMGFKGRYTQVKMRPSLEPLGCQKHARPSLCAVAMLYGYTSPFTLEIQREAQNWEPKKASAERAPDLVRRSGGLWQSQASLASLASNTSTILKCCWQKQKMVQPLWRTVYFLESKVETSLVTLVFCSLNIYPEGMKTLSTQRLGHEYFMQL